MDNEIGFMCCCHAIGLTWHYYNTFLLELVLIYSQYSFLIIDKYSTFKTNFVVFFFFSLLHFMWSSTTLDPIPKTCVLVLGCLVGAKFENVLDCFVDGCCTTLKSLLHLDSLQYFALYSITGCEGQRGCLKLGAWFSAKSSYHDDFEATRN